MTVCKTSTNDSEGDIVISDYGISSLALPYRTLPYLSFPFLYIYAACDCSEGILKIYLFYCSVGILKFYSFSDVMSNVKI